jgi:PhoH-like ATPase
MNKKYIFDTSALIADPSAYTKYPDSMAIIPIATLSELDKLKKQFNEAGKNARMAVRNLDEISSTGDISKGILLKDNILLKIDADYVNPSTEEFANFGPSDYGDTHILICAYLNNKENNATLISNDINLRVKAKSKGISAQMHREEASLNEIYMGHKTVEDEELGLILQQEKIINPEEFNLNLSINEYVSFENANHDTISMGKKVSKKHVQLLKKVYPWNMSARNKEQAFAVDAIMDREIDLVTLIGRAGSGKTLMALASALELVISKQEYNKLIIYKPIQSVGNDIGYLPGELSEKLAPWFQAIMDSFEVLFQSSSNKNNTDWKKNLEMFQKKGKIEMEAITYIRGRSIPNAIILLDEAQNCSKDEIKTILTRAGEGTKIILTGDIEQIDNKSLDSLDNGLVYVIEKFKNSSIAAHVTLTKGERSRLATEAANIL